MNIILNKTNTQLMIIKEITKDWKNGISTYDKHLIETRYNYFVKNKNNYFANLKNTLNIKR